MQNLFSGVITAIVTPFKSNGELDIEAYKKILINQKQNGINGVMIGGSTGEIATLSVDELVELLTISLYEKTENFNIYINIGTNCTLDTVKRLKRLQNIEVNNQKIDGIMAVVPYYNKPSQAGILAHFSVIAENAEHIPLCIYNVPSRTLVSIQPTTFLQLCMKYKNIIAIKEASGDTKNIAEIKLAINKHNCDVNILSGDDCIFANSLMMGAVGIISVSSHIVPKEILGIYQAYLNNDMYTMKEKSLLINNLNYSLFCTSNPVPLKWLMNQLDFCNVNVRLPLVELEEKEIILMKNILIELKNNKVILANNI